MNILVTGGAGFIGSHLTDQLIIEDHQVRILDNLEPQVHGNLAKLGSWPEYTNAQAEYVQGDVRDKDVVRQALTDIEVVFHFAAKVGVGQSMYQVEQYVDINIGGTATLLDVLVNEPSLRSRVRKLIVASSMSNYGEGEYECPEHGSVNPTIRPAAELNDRSWELTCHLDLDPIKGDRPLQRCNRPLRPRPTREIKPMITNSVYGISKKTQEELCLTVGDAYGIPTAALRFFNTYGTRQALSNPYTGVVAIFASRLLNGRPPEIFEDGQQTRDFIHVSDLVRANIMVMDDLEATGVYNVGTGQATSIKEVAERIVQHMDSPIEPVILDKYRKGDTRHCYADISQLAALGFKPKMSFDQGIAETIGWVLSQTAKDSFDEMRQDLDRRGLTL